MRAIVRYIVTFIWFLVAIVVGTIFRQNIEDFAAKHGADDVISNGWSVVTGAGYEFWLIAALGFASGATATLWADFALRKLPLEKWLEKARYRIFPGVKVHDGFSIGWSRAGNNPIELTEIGFSVKNLTGGAIIQPYIVGMSLFGGREFPVFIGTAKGRYPLSTVASIENGAEFTVSLDLRDYDLISEIEKTDVAGALETFIKKSNIRTSGYNGMYLEPFINEFHGVIITLDVHTKQTTIRITAQQIRDEIGKSQDRDIRRMQNDGVELIDNTNLIQSDSV